MFWKPPPVAYGPLPQPPKKNGEPGKALWYRFVEVDPTKTPGLHWLVKEGQTVMVLKSEQKQSEEDAAFSLRLKPLSQNQAGTCCEIVISTVS